MSESMQDVPPAVNPAYYDSSDDLPSIHHIAYDSPISDFSNSPILMEPVILRQALPLGNLSDQDVHEGVPNPRNNNYRMGIEEPQLRQQQQQQQQQQQNLVIKPTSVTVCCKNPNSTSWTCCQSLLIWPILILGWISLSISQIPIFPWLQASCNIEIDNHCQTPFLALSPWMIQNFSQPLWSLPSSTSFIDSSCFDHYHGNLFDNDSELCSKYQILRSTAALSFILGWLSYLFVLTMVCGCCCENWISFRPLLSWFMISSAFCGLGSAIVINHFLSRNPILYTWGAITPLEIGFGFKIFLVGFCLLFLTSILNLFRKKDHGVKEDQWKKNSTPNCCHFSCYCMNLCCFIPLILAMIVLPGLISLQFASGPVYTPYLYQSNATYQLYVNPEDSRLFLYSGNDSSVMYTAIKDIDGIPAQIVSILVSSVMEPVTTLSFKVDTNNILLLSEVINNGTTFLFNWSFVDPSSPNFRLTVLSSASQFKFDTPIFSVPSSNLFPLSPPFPTYNTSQIYSDPNSGFTLNVSNTELEALDNAIVEVEIIRKDASSKGNWKTNSHQKLKALNIGGGSYFVPFPSNPAPTDSEWMNSYMNTTSYHLNITCLHLKTLTLSSSHICNVIQQMLLQQNNSMNQEANDLIQSCNLMIKSWVAGCLPIQVSTNMTEQNSNGNQHLQSFNRSHISPNQFWTILPSYDQIVALGDKIESLSENALLDLFVLYYQDGWFQDATHKSFELVSKRYKDRPKVAYYFGATVIESALLLQNLKHRPTCNDVTKAGDSLPFSTTIDLGLPTGQFTFNYETYTVKDAMTISQNGVLLFSTGCVGTGGWQSTTINYNSLSSVINIDVTPNCENLASGMSTEWTFEVKCTVSTPECIDSQQCICPGIGYPAALQVKAPSSNGCQLVYGFPGSAFPQSIINRKYWSQGFTACCNQRDICYSTCNTGRIGCDWDFENCLSKACSYFSANDGNYMECSKYAKIYAGAFEKNGGGSFTRAQLESCVCSSV